MARQVGHNFATIGEANGVIETRRTDMKLVATAAALSSYTYSVILAYHDESGRIIHTMPSINIPCESLAHAIAVADAYNKADRYPD